MRNPWQLYDDLVDLVPPDLRVTSCTVSHWAMVTDDGGGAGVAAVYRGGPADREVDRDFVGRPLRDLAAQVRSWDLELASLGAAALNCALTTSERLEPLTTRAGLEGMTSIFDLRAADMPGRRIGVVGHFANVARLREQGHEVVVLERRPEHADLPDPAAEYVLPGCDLVFITGSTVINKTLPRLLELTRDTEVVLVGPSTPLAAEVLTGRVAELAGSLVEPAEELPRLVAAGARLSDLRSYLQPFTAVLGTGEEPRDTRGTAGTSAADTEANG